MAIEGVTGISSAKGQYPELVIPVTNLEQTPKKQVEQNRGGTLQRGAVSEESSEEKRDLDSENLDNQVERANQLAESLDRSIRFFVHKDSGRTAINVVDNSTHQVIKTIPPEQFLDFAAKVKKIAGIFFDKFV